MLVVLIMLVVLMLMLLKMLKVLKVLKMLEKFGCWKTSSLFLVQHKPTYATSKGKNNIECTSPSKYRIRTLGKRVPV